MRPFARLILNAPPSAPAPAAGAEVGAELVGLVTLAFQGHRRRGGGVDYAALRTSDAWREAETCAGRLRALDLRSLEPYPARLAFWLNVYNALVLHGIVALGLERSVRETWGFFGRVGYQVGAFALSADDIEHGLLRGNRARKLPPWPPFRADDARLALACQPPDPRIHFALNCGARSCPPVRVYRAEVVDAQLDAAARSFINQELGLQPDGRIACSRVFRWYRRDFPAGEGLRAFLLQYLDEGPVRAAVAAGSRLCHTLRPYSWALPHSVAAQGPPHVVIVGGGFGGLSVARRLAGRPVRVTLLDRRNHHLFQPLLYQVATAALNPADIAAPVRSILRKATNVTVLLAEVEAVDLAGRRVRTDRDEIGYDALVLAVGASHSYFGHDEWEALAPGLKTVEDALEIRRRVLLAYEAAERERDEDARRTLLTFVVIGGGPTGVELAGALGEISRQTIARDFRRIDPTKARVILLEAGPRILSAFPETLSRRAEDALRRIGVEVRTRTTVTGLTPDTVWLAGEPIRARTVLWAAGVAAAPLTRTLGVPLDRHGRVVVEPDLSIPGHPEAFAIGDMCTFLHQDGAPLPGLAPVAIQQGRTAADNLLRRLRGQPTRAFRYRDRGTMATVGRAAAVAVVGPLKMSGLVAWLAWLLVHIASLIGFRNRFLVLFQWAWAYVTWQRGARLITGPWRAHERTPTPGAGDRAS